MVDIRDIGEVAAGELLRREKASVPLPRETYALVGPDGDETPQLSRPTV